MTTDDKIEALRYEHAEADMTKSKIWKVFFYLLGLTALEFIIALGFVETGLIEKSIAVVVVYILLTLLKAFYIVAYFMHLNFEAKGFKVMLGIPLFLLIYLIILVLIEGDYIGMILSR
ncbi:cytochrome C oxidase subunit IV family protein [Albibacterium sp.]|uniref:cytochrome C oxidase subunit IV family protein n=1 Tax=Albibacterium sp. TaxID=2952885 RepID=UPI002CE9CE3B|nr:cytochrome C oxidase subunit IV family protein [Albibacterium sp.]HUH19780.1 cytochrome C oxidase subunit IV family protein [Albibacterium sp.]